MERLALITVFLVLLCSSFSNGATIWATISNQAQFTNLKAVISGCQLCDTFTNPSGGFLLTTDGNFLAADNAAISASVTVTQTDVGNWFFANTTLHRPVVPVVLSNVVNDETLPNSNAGVMRFNLYGATYTVNGIPITEVIDCTDGGVKQTIWKVSQTTVPNLSTFNLYTLLQQDAQLTQFTSAAQKVAAIVNRLVSTSQATTAFAPVDAAFSLLGQTLYNRLDLFFSLDKAPVLNRLTRFVNYHLLDTTYWKYGIADQAYTTLEGAQFTISTGGTKIQDSQTRTAQITDFNIKPTNGVIHKIDRVLYPEALPTFASTLDDWDSYQTNKFTTFKTNAMSTGFYSNYLSNTSATGFTFIAPTVGGVTLAVQLNHIIAGVYFISNLSNDLVLPTIGGSTMRFNLYESWYVNGSPFVNTFMDWVTVNGALHVYNGQFPINFFTETVWDKLPNSAFKTALTNAGLDTLLQQDGSYTVIVPSETAFNEAGTVDEDRLKFHILTTTVFKPYPGLYQSLQGTLVNLTDSFEGIAVQGWSVQTKGCTNGMVVLIDGILPQPPKVSTTASNIQTTQAQATGGSQDTTASYQPTGSTASFTSLCFMLYIVIFILFSAL